VPVTPTAPVNASTQLPDMSHLGVKEPSVTFGMFPAENFHSLRDRNFPIVNGLALTCFSLDHDRLTQNFVWIRKNEQPLLAAVLPATTIDRLVALPSNAENKDQLEELRVQLKELDATKSCKLTQPTVSFLSTYCYNYSIFSTNPIPQYYITIKYPLKMVTKSKIKFNISLVNNLLFH
jgi:hypothetical protein